MATSTQWQLARHAAEQYERVLVPSILGPAARVLVDRIPLRPGAVVLDAGCGTGAAARCAAARLGAGGQVIGVDVNAGMLAVARAKAVDGETTIRWQEGSVVALPVADRSVDVIVCAQVAQFLPDRPVALAEFRRVLKPGGDLGLSVWSALGDSPYFAALIDAMDTHVGPEVAQGLRAAFGLSDADVIYDLLAGAGFREIGIASVPIAIDLPKPDAFVPLHVRATPMGVGFEGASSEAQAAVVRDVIEAMGPFAHDGGVRVPFGMHVARAVR